MGFPQSALASWWCNLCSAHLWAVMLVSSVLCESPRPSITILNTIPEKPSLSWWSGLSLGFIAYSAFCCCPWLPLYVEVKFLLLKTPYSSDTGAKDHWAGTDLNVSFQRISFSWYLKAPCKLPKDEGNQQSYLDLTPENHFNSQNSTVILREH